MPCRVGVVARACSVGNPGTLNVWLRDRMVGGNYYILTYLDHFTKFTEAYPIPNKEAETVCRVLAEKIIPRFRTAIQLLMDQGREFDNRLMKGLSKIFGIDKSVPALTGLLPTGRPSVFIEHYTRC